MIFPSAPDQRISQIQIAVDEEETASYGNRILVCMDESASRGRYVPMRHKKGSVCFEMLQNRYTRLIEYLLHFEAGHRMIRVKEGNHGQYETFRNLEMVIPYPNPKRQ